ncbi:hypothetical protein GGS24DRAFT_507468 [Hypoxylon argillaceum]|nr:hypothetical protein GGS24DRAFT_507468 [Hypoxylon argillaceum]KAI1150930.1 hypothetical protein F4825DRAFT_477560 [Nemania diffusa]
MDSHVTPKAMGALNPGNNQKGFSAPPSQPGQQQPWKNWFSPQSLDTEEHMKEDEKPQTCQGWTQAVTNIGAKLDSTRTFKSRRMPCNKESRDTP